MRVPPIQTDSFRERLLKRETPAEKRAFAILSRFPLLLEKERIIHLNSGKKYYVDLWLPAYRLGIELDGGIHKIQESRDVRRDMEIMEMGASIAIIRFTNEDIFRRPDHFIHAVAGMMLQRTSYMNSFEEGRFLLDKQDRKFENLGPWAVLYTRDAIPPIVIKDKYAFGVNRWGCTLDGFILQ